jgi:hypothetical protein
MRRLHLPFVVGRISKNDCRVIVLDRVFPMPIRGPWELRAVFGR